MVKHARAWAGRVTALALVGLTVSGCIGKQWGTQNVPFFPVSEDTRQSLEELTRLEGFLTSKIGEWTLADVESHIRESSRRVREAEEYPDPLPERHAAINGKQAVVSRVWRFATVDRTSVKVPMFGHHNGQRVGFMLQADEQGGKLARVQTSFTYLTDREKDFSTKPLVTGALAVGGALILLSAD
jgi:hypothetical protein